VGCREYVNSVIIRFYAFHRHLPESRQLSVPSVIYQFQTADGHLYLVIDLIVDNREVFVSRLFTPCTDYYCFLGRLASLKT